MPELPEVETIKGDLSRCILHKRIAAVKVIDGRILRSPAARFIKALEGSVIQSIDRRGKALLIRLDSGDVLTVQLMMTGQLITADVPDKHTCLRITFSDGSVLLYNDQRRFGQLRVVESLDEFRHVNDLGPEPLGQDFSADYIFAYTRGRTRPVKTLLLDHTFVAGIGNIYACELLFRAGISPLRPSQRLSRKDAARIHQEAVRVLKEAIRHRGSSMRNYRDASGEQGAFKALIEVYAREGGVCLRCSSLIKRIVQAGRSTFYCARCQK